MCVCVCVCARACVRACVCFAFVLLDIDDLSLLIVLGEIYHAVYGQSKKVKMLVQEEILDYLMEKRPDHLERIVKTSNFQKERNEQGCFLLITMENWTSNAEEKIRDAFKLFISRYDSRQIPVDPEILDISVDAVFRLKQSFILNESRRDVDVRLKANDIFITGRKTDVKESIGRFEKLKEYFLKSEKKKLLSTAQEHCVKRILQKYPMFEKDTIIDLLKTDTSLCDETLLTNITAIDKIYTEKDELAFFQTEAFINCQYRILRECRVVLATQEQRECKRMKRGVELEAIVGDITTVTVNICTIIRIF